MILTANQREIGKWQIEKNIELKYMLAQSRHIKYNAEKNENHLSHTGLGAGNDDDSKVKVEELPERVNELFGQYAKYERIKEKLIGLTIRYCPEPGAVIEQLIQSNIEDAGMRQ